jgi:threonine dehydrogenase-like Zn-dependent dehydrogenase
MVERIAFDMDQLRRKEIRIQNVRRQNECTRAALDLIEAGSLRVDPLITHRFPFAQTPAAFELVESYRDGVVKAMIEVG